MPFFKKYIPLLIAIILIYGWYLATHAPTQHQSHMNVLGANTNITLYEEPDSGHQPILDAIASAQKQILVEVYLLSDKQVISALEDAKSHGVDVKVMMEQHPVGGGGLNQKTEQALDADGVQTEWSNPGFALTHEKTITIDNTETFILSQNLTASAFSKNREYDVLDTDPHDVTEIQTIFQDDWQRTSFSPPTTSDVIESPDNSRSVLEALVQNAGGMIDAETEDINDNDLVNLLSQKAKTMTVRLLVPTLSQLSSNRTALQTLANSGVKVETIALPYMHAKLLLTSDKAYVGSINFSTQSMDRNREVGIILTQPDALQTLETTFEQDWNKGTQFQN